MGNSLLRRAGFGIRTVQTQGENLKALQIKLVIPMVLVLFLHTIVKWRIELLKNYISEAKANSFVHATMA